MSEESHQERTEEPTPKRKQEARDKGNIARSKELATTVVMLVGATGVLMLAGQAGQGIFKVFRDNFSVDRSALYDDAHVVHALAQSMTDALVLMIPFMLLVLIASIGGSAVLGGLHVNLSSVSFKFEKIDPIKGFKRIFSVRALMELAKALAKFFIIGICSLLLLWHQQDNLLSLASQDTTQAIHHAFHLLAWSFLILSASLILIALVDVPFQIWQHAQKLKMTHQEIKDEFKDTEGKPEIKQKIRQMQQEIARGRMMEEVPKADVVITNPTHFSVALAYDQHKRGAPKVVAKGLDIIALQIQKVAKANEVITLELPPLARAIYYSTELEGEIPTALYVAVAQVLAYVYQLRQHKTGYGAKPQPPSDLPIPDEYRR